MKKKYICEICEYESDKLGVCPNCEIDLVEKEKLEEEELCAHGIPKSECDECVDESEE